MDLFGSHYFPLSDRAHPSARTWGNYRAGGGSTEGGGGLEGDGKGYTVQFQGCDAFVSTLSAKALKGVIVCDVRRDDGPWLWLWPCARHGYT